MASTRIFALSFPDVSAVFCWKYYTMFLYQPQESNEWIGCHFLSQKLSFLLDIPKKEDIIDKPV
jgi:hypothetical protein